MDTNTKISNEVETAFEKGLSFEKEFCEFLKTDLGWETARLRTQLPAANNMRGTQVDVLAERLTEQGVKLQRLGRFYFIVCFIPIIIGFFVLFYDYDTGFTFLITGIFIELLAVIFFTLSKAKRKEHVWVECKNRKTKTDIRQIQLTINQVNEYKRSGNKEYKFNEIFFVSSSGFVENALKLANDNNIKCYYKENNQFVLAKYWEHY